MANTITGFTTFVTRTVISSSDMNTNNQYLKDHSPLWHVYTLTTSDFSAVTNTNTGTLFNADPKEVIHGYGVKHSTAFSGGTVSDFDFSLGDSTDRYRYIDSFDAFQAVSAGALEFSSDFYLPNFDSTSAVEWTAVATGSTLDSLTAGVIEVFVLKSILP